MGVNLRYVYHNGRAVAGARWYLRNADHVGTRVRMRGRPRVINHGRLVVGDRVQFVSTTATLELVAEYGGMLEIGSQSLINFGCSIVATRSVQIGQRCQIGPYTMMIDNDYHHVDPARRLERPESLPIRIEDNVWIGSRSIVTPGVTIGEDSCVGAGSVVTHDVPPRTLVAGVPARIIREL